MRRVSGGFHRLGHPSVIALCMQIAFGVGIGVPVSEQLC